MKSSDIVSFIIARRKELGISQGDIANKIGYSSQLISNWETGKSIPDLAILANIANILEISIDDLFACKVSETKKIDNKPFDVNLFSQTLKKLRLINSFTQKDVATKVGVSYATIISWEKGSSLPNINQFEVLKNIFNVSYSDLYYGNLNYKIPKKHNKMLIGVVSSIVCVGLITALSIVLVQASNRGGNKDISTSEIVTTSYPTSASNPSTAIVPTTASTSQATTASSKTTSNPTTASSVTTATSITTTSSSSSTSIAPVSDDFTYHYSGDKKMFLITSYLGNDSTVVIPSEINGDLIEGIDSSALSNNSTIEHIVFPECIKVIQSSAFSSCKKLKDVNLPKTMDLLGSRAFADCPLLTTVKMPLTLKEMNVGVFANCSSLKQIDIPKGVKSFNFNVIGGCYSLEKITFQEGLLEVDGGLSNNLKLTSLDLPNTVTTIGDGLFYNSPFRNCVLPDSVTYIGELLFHPLSIDSIIIPKGVEYWKFSADLVSFNKVNIFFKGDESDWNKINFIAGYTPNLEESTCIHMYSETPKVNCWHFVDKIPTLY